MSASLAPSTRTTARAFGGLWVARDVAALGDSILLVALLCWSYQLQESATTASILVVAMLLPPFLLRPLAPKLVSRGSARVVGAAGQLLRAAALTPLLGVGVGVNQQLVLSVAFVAAIPSALVQAAHETSLRALVKTEHLPAAQKALSRTRLLALAAGPAAGTALYGASGLDGATLAVLAALAVSAVGLAVARPPVATDSSGDQAIGPADLQRGLLLALRHPSLRTVAVVQMWTALSTGGLAVVMVAFTVWGVYATSENVGLLLAAMGLGAVAASLVWDRFGHLFLPSHSIATAIGIAATSGFALSLTSSMNEAAPFCVATGFGLRLLGAGVDALLAAHSTPEQRPALLAGLDMATSTACILSAVAMGPLCDLMTPRLTLVLACILLSVLGLYAFASVANPDERALPNRYNG